LVCGAGGFIGAHLVSRLRREGVWVRGADRKQPRFSESDAAEFFVGDLTDPKFCDRVLDRTFDEIYHLRAEMGGAEYIYSPANDAAIMREGIAIDINALRACQ